MFKLISRLSAIALCLTLAVFAADTPRPLADVSLDPPPGRGNGKISLKQYKGKTLLIAILSTDCGACAEMVAILNKVQQDYRAKGIQVVGAAVDANALAGIGPFIDRNRPIFPVGILGEDDTRYLADFNDSDRPYVPILIFADAKGTVQYQFFANSPFFQQPETAVRGLLDTMLRLQ